MTDGAPSYYYSADGQSVGPIGLDEVAAAISAGTIKRATPICPVGTSEWTDADQVPEIQQLLAAGQQQVAHTAPPPPPETKDCMWCGEPIRVNAKLCRFCGKEQLQEQAERVLYQGPGNLPIGQLVVDILLCFVLVGFVTGLLHLLEHQSKKYRVTTKKVEVERGLASKSINTMELFRVQDLSYRSEWGKGTIVLVSSDRSHRLMSLPIPNAKKVFEELQVAVESARKEHGVTVRESM